MNEDEKVNIHAALAMIASGQLLFLGLQQAACAPSLKTLLPRIEIGVKIQL